MAGASTTEAAVYNRSLDAPDETREFGKGKAEVVNVGGVTIFRLYHEPGWRWSEHIKPIAKTDRCEVRHVGLVTPLSSHLDTMPGRSATKPPPCSTSTERVTRGRR